MSEKCDKKSRRHRKKSKTGDDVEFDDDFVDRQLRMAEKQMERAMGQMRLAGKVSRTASQMEGEADRMRKDKDPQNKGITINQHGTLINIQSAENIQVGSNNTMIVMNNSGKGKKPPRRRKSNDSDEEAVIDRAQQNQARQAGEATDRLTEEILKSERTVTEQDLDLASKSVGSDWRRFFRFLGLDDTLLSQLHEDYYVQGIREVVFQGLLLWKRQRDRQATLGVLTNTLTKVGYADAVKSFNL